MAKSIYTCLILIGYLNFAYGQKSKYDTAFVAKGISRAYSSYRQGMGEHLILYNGSDHKLHRSVNGQHPYFGSDAWSIGFVMLNGSRYDDVELLYNSCTDKLLLNSFDDSYVIQLNSDEVQSFGIGKHIFNKLKSSHMQSGFYELLFNGAIKVYAKRTKSSKEQISNSRINQIYLERNKYFVFQNGQYFLINGKKSILNLFSNRKKEIKQFLRQNNISFSRNREVALIAITKFYSEK